MNKWQFTVLSILTVIVCIGIYIIIQISIPTYNENIPSNLINPICDKLNSKQQEWILNCISANDPFLTDNIKECHETSKFLFCIATPTPFPTPIEK